MKNLNSELTYVVKSASREPRPIKLSIFEAERYDTAVIIQQLIGNLVYYSNQGRFEPNLAASWKMKDPHHWAINLKSGYTCENGEAITAASFKVSLERSIRLFNKEAPAPVFKKLLGYDDFIQGSESIRGIEAVGDVLNFKFAEPVKSGLIEFLAYAQFGYICAENYNVDGTWKDDFNFVSSGPYRLRSASPGNRYVLERRDQWKDIEDAPKVVYILQNAPSTFSTPAILDTKTFALPPNGFSSFNLVPEWLAHVVLGRIDKGFFSNVENRNAFRAALERSKNDLAAPTENFIKSSVLFRSLGDSTAKEHPQFSRARSLPNQELIIQGKEPAGANLIQAYNWQVIKRAFDSLGWKYRFAGDDGEWSALVDHGKWDLRFANQIVGGDAEPWMIGSMFCTDVGPNFPDPTQAICKAYHALEKDEISELEFAETFQRTVETDAAVLPIGNFGMQWHVSEGIKRESISPLVGVIQFEDVRLE